MPYGLKEAKDFVDYAQARPYAKAKNLAELWMNLPRESVVEAVELEFEPVAMQEEEGVSAGEWYPVPNVIRVQVLSSILDVLEDEHLEELHDIVHVYDPGRSVN